MALSIASGVQDTETGVADEHVIDMDNQIKMKQDDTAQFMTILGKLPSKAATQIKVNWLEDEYMPVLTSLASGSITATGQTAISVAAGEGAYIRAGDILYVAESGEKLSVTSLTADALTVVRSVGGVAAATAASGGQIVILGPSAAQGADTGTLKATKRVLGFNYTQIFRDPFGFTGTEAEAELYGADDPERETAKKAVEHRRHLEASLWVGGRDFTSNPPSSIGYMGGVSEFLVSNVFTAFGAISLSAFDLKMQQIFQQGSMNKVIFAAPTAAGALSRLLSNNWVRAPQDATKYGAKVNAFVNGAYGTDVPVIVKREWGAFASSGAPAAFSLGGAVFVLDLDRLSRRPFRNRDTRLLPNRQGNGEDKVVFDYLTEMSLELANESAHGVFWGVTG
jgi:hypothetical protein